MSGNDLIMTAPPGRPRGPRDPATGAPDFVLPDHRGGEFHLGGALAAETAPVVVVFFRGHWCPYCRRYLAKLQAHWSRFAERRVRLVAISPEPPATSRMLVDQLGLTFPVLADTAGTVIDAYGTRNGFGSARVLLPHPSVFVVDGDGRVRFRSVDRNYKKRTTIRTIFAALDEPAAAAPPL